MKFQQLCPYLPSKEKYRADSYNHKSLESQSANSTLRISSNISTLPGKSPIRVWELVVELPLPDRYFKDNHWNFWPLSRVMALHSLRGVPYVYVMRCRLLRPVFKDLSGRLEDAAPPAIAKIVPK